MATQPLPVPDYFRFEWDSPEEAARYWTVDLMHWPNGLSPLSATMDMPPFLRGAVKASEALSMPLRSFSSKWVRGYVYMSLEPYPADELEARMAQLQAKMMQHIPGLLDRWRDEYEPEVRAINQETLTGNYAQMSDGDLADLLRKLVEKREREGELHFLAVFPAMGAVMFYEQLYTQLFGAPRAEEHLQLLQGFPNKSTESNNELWRLGVEARRRPAVLELIRRVAPTQAHAALSESAEGRAYRGAVGEFLDKYGWRSNELDIASPTWVEEPATAYKLIREYASRDDYDPEEEIRSLAAARERRQKLLLDRLSGPDSPAGMFQMVLAGAQQYLPIQEDHNFWIDQQGLAVERVPVLEAARRLCAAGRLGEPDEVFYLRFDELQDILRGAKGDLRQLALRRRREQEENLKLTPPPVLGTPPPDQGGSPATVMRDKFWGAPPAESPDPRVINGNGASAGKSTGTARVILSLDDADRLAPGEILVCPATMPPWTPLFGIAAAVVTDHGGVLSHTAIVAREYQIPAVVGAKIATELIKDGQKITVDGDAGTVRLEG